MELIDLYDENFQNTGIIQDRNAPVPADMYRAAVGIWVINAQHQILLTRRSLDKSYAPGKWENTGGHVKHGETMREAVIRELAEETGITVSPDEVIFLGSAKSWPYLGMNYCVHREVELSEVRLQEHETCEVMWADIPTFMQMMNKGLLAPSTKEHLQGYQRRFWEELRR